MKLFFLKTFGGLDSKYYFRHFIFGLLLAAFVYLTTKENIKASEVLLLVSSTLLYPYSRFVYESIIGFIFGENTFILPAWIVLILKFITIMLCYSLAVYIAPLGLIYLYFYHSKKIKKDNEK